MSADVPWYEMPALIQKARAVFSQLGKHQMTALTKDAIFAASDLTTETVACPEWGGDVIIRSMTGTQRDAYEQSLMTKDDAGNFAVDTENMKVKLVVYTAVDEAGNALFAAADIPALSGKSAAVIERLANVATRLSGLGKQATEDAAKN